MHVNLGEELEARCALAIARAAPCIRGLDEPRPGAAIPVAVARPPARPVRSRRHGRRWSASLPRSSAGSGSPSTATTTATASRPRSSCAGRSSCSAPTSSTSCPSAFATATGCSRPRSSGCTPTASRSSSRWTAASAPPRRRGGPASSASISSSPTITSPTRRCRWRVAVINPRRHDCTYPDKNLAGVGVALKLGHALRLERDRDWPAAGVHQDRGYRHVGRRRARQGENRIIAKLGPTCRRQGRTGSEYGCCSRSLASPASKIDSEHVAPSWRRA